MMTTLIVDDHPMVRDGLAVMLAARRIFEVVGTCTNGEEAVAHVRQHGCPDVILSDVRMPGADGLQLLKAAKKKIRINKKTGKITLKKGLKKGTYKVRIRVRAAGTYKYKAKTRTVTVRIRVK